MKRNSLFVAQFLMNNDQHPLFSGVIDTPFGDGLLDGTEVVSVKDIVSLQDTDGKPVTEMPKGYGHLFYYSELSGTHYNSLCVTLTRVTQPDQDPFYVLETVDKVNALQERFAQIEVVAS